MKLALNLTFEEGMKIVKAVKEVAIENGWNAEELDECGVIEEYSRVIDAALTAMGIKVRINGTPSDEEEDEDFNEDELDLDYDDDDDDDDEDDDEEEENDDDDNTAYSLTAKGEFVLRYTNAGYPFEEACKIADILFGDGE